MIDIAGIAKAAVDSLSANPNERWLDIATPGMIAGDILALIDAVFDASDAAGIALKGVKVDPMQVALPTDAPYQNAFVRRGRLIVVDLDVDDRVIVRRR